MITYGLAKQLKDAEFPQENGFRSDMECNCKDTFEGVCYHKKYPDSTDSWEKEFDEKFVFIDHDDTKIVGLYCKESKVIEYWQDYVIKKFISELRQKAVEETLKDIYGLERGSIAYYPKKKGIEL